MFRPDVAASEDRIKSKKLVVSRYDSDMHFNSVALVLQCCVRLSVVCDTYCG